MGLFDFVDSTLGTDFTGNKAFGKYKEGAAAQQAANDAALAEMQKYGEKAVSTYKEYVNKGMAAEDAMRQSAIDTLKSGDAQAMAAYQQEYQAGQAKRSPYEDAATQMMGALPQLQSAMGMPGSSTYDVAVSPMYQWQKDQSDKDLAAYLNATGMNTDNTAAYIRSQNLAQLNAQETERQVSDLQNMVGMGMQYGSTLGQNEFQAARDMSSMYGNSALNEANILNQGAINRGQTYGNMGQTLAGWDMDMGQNVANNLIAGGNTAMNLAVADASRTNPMNELINTGINLWGQGAFSNKQMSSPKVDTGSQVDPNIYKLAF